MGCPDGAITISVMGLFPLYTMSTLLQEFKNNIEKRLIGVGGPSVLLLLVNE